jgi:2-polyprenyl-3-methyl-5-hydroxy-6-metoxy-1,4-benzoquinol methylase
MVDQCDFCGSEKWIPLLVRSDNAQVMSCCRCGLVFVFPIASPNRIHELYLSNDYFFKENTGENSKVGYQCTDYADSEILTFQAVEEIQLLEEFMSFSGQKVLEIGSATGEFLIQLRNRGSQVMGIEPNNYARTQSIERYSLDIFQGFYQDFPQDHKEFDVIIAREVIEHLESPSNFFRFILERLKEGGFLIITTPNYRVGLSQKEKWLGFQSSFEHLYFFSDEMLIRFARKFHFELVSWWTYDTTQNDVNRISRFNINRLYRFLTMIIKIGTKQYHIKIRKRGGICIRDNWCRYGDGHNLLIVFRRTR